MKIEIDYKGAFAVCNIELMDEPGKIVNCNDADTKSQTYVLSAFQTIKEHWQREQRLARFKNLPVIHVKRQIEVLPDSIPVLQQLHKEGVLINLQYEISTAHSPKIEVTLSDSHKKITTADWLIQNAEDRWWSMDSGYHRMLEEYQKIVIER